MGSKITPPLIFGDSLEGVMGLRIYTLGYDLL